MPSPVWVNSSALLAEFCDEVVAHEVAGLDTEFYGVDLDTQSPVARSICHVWSVAVPDGDLHPRGHTGARVWVLPAAALTHPGVTEWLEDPAFRKCVHNQPVDAHTIRNHGVVLRGGINTLAMARFVYPERVKNGGFGLDGLGTDLVGIGKTEDFEDLLGYDDMETRDELVWKKRCACGVLGCRKKKEPHDVKEPEEVWVSREVKVRRLIPLPELTPEHPLWTRYLNYAAWDAVLALWVYQVMCRDAKKVRSYPWV